MKRWERKHTKSIWKRRVQMMFSGTKTYSSKLMKYFSSTLTQKNKNKTRKNNANIGQMYMFRNLTDQKILLYRLTEHAIKCLTVNVETVKKALAHTDTHNNNRARLRLRWSVGGKRNKVDQSNI